MNEEEKSPIKKKCQKKQQIEQWIIEMMHMTSSSFSTVISFNNSSQSISISPSVSHLMQSSQSNLTYVDSKYSSDLIIWHI